MLTPGAIAIQILIKGICSPSFFFDSYTHLLEFYTLTHTHMVR